MLKNPLFGNHRMAKLVICVHVYVISLYINFAFLFLLFLGWSFSLKNIYGKKLLLFFTYHNFVALDYKGYKGCRYNNLKTSITFFILFFSCSFDMWICFDVNLVAL